MEFKQSLAQRIIIAFALMSALVAGAFAMGIVATVHLVEEKLISAGLGGDLQRLLLMDSVEDWRHRPEPDQLFYFSGGRGDFQLPKDLRHLDAGFHEVFRDALSYHAMVEIVDGRRYVLLQDQSDFEERERVLFAVVLVGFVLSLALAVFLGWVLARKVMAPVVRLERQGIYQAAQLGVVLRDTHCADAGLCQQLLLVAGGVFFHQAHGVGFALQRLDQEAADLFHRHALQLLGELLGFRGVVLTGQVDVAEALENRLRSVHCVVLCNQQGGAEGRFVGVVTIVFHASGANAAAVVGGFQFVPVEVLYGLAFLLFTLGLNQHHRQIADLREVARTAGGGRFGRVETFVVGTADQLPQQLD